MLCSKVPSTRCFGNCCGFQLFSLLSGSAVNDLLHVCLNGTFVHCQAIRMIIFSWLCLNVVGLSYPPRNILIECSNPGAIFRVIAKDPPLKNRDHFWILLGGSLYIMWKLKICDFHFRRVLVFLIFFKGLWNDMKWLCNLGHSKETQPRVTFSLYIYIYMFLICFLVSPAKDEKPVLQKMFGILILYKWHFWNFISPVVIFKVIFVKWNLPRSRQYYEGDTVSKDHLGRDAPAQQYGLLGQSHSSLVNGLSLNANTI